MSPSGVTFQRHLHATPSHHLPCARPSLRFHVGLLADLPADPLDVVGLGRVRLRVLLRASNSAPHGPQHARLPCTSQSPRVCSDSCPLSQLMMPSNHLILCCLLPSIFPSIRVFSNESALQRGDQGIGASASVLPMNIQGWSPLAWTGWISLQSKGFSKVFSNTRVQKHQFFGAQLSL